MHLVLVRVQRDWPWTACDSIKCTKPAWTNSLWRTSVHSVIPELNLMPNSSSELPSKEKLKMERSVPADVTELYYQIKIFLGYHSQSNYITSRCFNVDKSIEHAFLFHLMVSWNQYLNFGQTLLFPIGACPRADAIMWSQFLAGSVLGGPSLHWSWMLSCNSSQFIY